MLRYKPAVNQMFSIYSGAFFKNASMVKTEIVDNDSLRQTWFGHISLSSFMVLAGLLSETDPLTVKYL